MERHVIARPLQCFQRALASLVLVCLYAAAAQAQPVPPGASEPAAAQEPTEQRAINSVLSSTRIRLYTDVGFGRPPQEKLPEGGLQGSKYSFQMADIELFITSRLSDQWSVLADILFTSDFSNEFESETDRLLIQYSANNYFRVGFGKFNSGIGYYPNQFHRAKFYQIATGRPLMFSDEDNGGVLPIHQVGITAQGEIPSGALGLHYIAEISNGRAFSLASAEIQNFADRDNFKAVNGGLFVRPDAAPALDAGFTVYHDKVETDTHAKFDEMITAVHATWVTPNFEFLNELAVLKHTAEAGDTTDTTKTFYTQISPRFGVTRPYARYEYQDVPATDPLFGLGDVSPAAGVRKAFSAGVHYSLGAFAVIKVQYDRAQQFGVWANGAHAQLAVAF